MIVLCVYFLFCHSDCRIGRIRYLAKKVGGLGGRIEYAFYKKQCSLWSVRNLLPTYPRRSGDMKKHNPYTIPPRLYKNIECGFAELYNWSNDAYNVQSWIHDAFLRRDKETPDNSYPSFKQNRTGERWSYLNELEK